MTKTPEYIQVGVTALRGTDGKLLPAVPMYIKLEDAGLYNDKTGLSQGEEKACDEMARAMTKKFKEYMDGCKKARKKKEQRKTI